MTELYSHWSLSFDQSLSELFLPFSKTLESSPLRSAFKARRISEIGSRSTFHANVDFEGEKIGPSFLFSGGEKCPRDRYSYLAYESGDRLKLT